MNPRIPAFSTTLACSTSFMGAIEAAGMIGRSDLSLALVGGVETMSHVSLALKTETADRVQAAAAHDPAAAAAMLGAVGAADFDLPRGAWANRQSGRSQGQHTEDTARHFAIPREAQDHRALLSHQAAVAGQDSGFFDDLIVPFAGLVRDTLPRRDTSLEKLASLPPVFDAAGVLTAGNSSPVTDGAAGVWIGDRAGMARLGRPASVRLLALADQRDGLPRQRGRDLDGAGPRDPAAPRTAWPALRGHRLLEHPRGLRRTGAGQRRGRLGPAISDHQGRGGLRPRHLPLGPAQPARRLAGHRTPLRGDRRADPEPGGQGDGGPFARRPGCRLPLRRRRPGTVTLLQRVEPSDATADRNRSI